MKTLFVFGLALFALQACSSSPPAATPAAQPVAVPQPAAPAPHAVSQTPVATVAPTPDSGDTVIAAVRGSFITQKDLEPILIEAYGLNVLMTVVQRELVHHEAEKTHISVTPADITHELALTLQALKHATEQVDPSTGATSRPSEEDISPAEAQQLLDRVLQESHVSQAEFNIIVEVNTYLRKIAEPQVNAQMTDAVIEKHFNMMYGEKVKVHYIVCDNMLDAAQVRRDLAAGIQFEDVARNRSKDWRTAPSGGELPPFTLQDNRFPDEFKKVAFLLKQGEVSDAVQVGNFVYIAKLIDRIKPEHARFEDYKDTARKDLYDQAMQAAVAAMRQNLARMALDSLHIQNPVLKAQWEQKLTAGKKNQISNPQDIRQEMDRERSATTLPSLQSSAAPPATMPATQSPAR